MNSILCVFLTHFRNSVFPLLQVQWKFKQKKTPFFQRTEDFNDILVHRQWWHTVGQKSPNAWIHVPRCFSLSTAGNSTCSYSAPSEDCSSPLRSVLCQAPLTWSNSVLFESLSPYHSYSHWNTGMTPCLLPPLCTFSRSVTCLCLSKTFFH